jgi:leader peptidase (prepilin peptidase)/N-methyltransferase
MELLDTFAASPALFISSCVALGLLIGSFLNVVIYRLPVMMDNELRAECALLAANDAGTNDPAAEDAAELPAKPAFNLVVPRSACPKCRAPITALQNIPVVSWLALRGKCANCKAPISPRYPLIELLTGVASGLVAWRFGFGITALAGLFFTWFLIALTFIDLDTFLLPDQLTLSLVWGGLLLSLWQPVWAPGAAPVTPVDSIIGAAAGYLSLWSVFWLFLLIRKKEGMGYGDFKLFAAFGAWFGWQMLLPIILFASLVGSVVGIWLIYRTRKGFETQIPFGPYLAGGGWLALFFGHVVVARIFHPPVG